VLWVWLSVSSRGPLVCAPDKVEGRGTGQGCSCFQLSTSHAEGLVAPKRVAEAGKFRGDGGGWE
jgi:hypothetical protein